MNIFINGELVKVVIPSISLAKLLEMRGVNPVGTAVAVNNRLVKKDQWSIHKLQEGDNLTIISAAFGG